jgi:hypothetical protein
MGTCYRRTFPVFRNFVASLYIVVFGTSLTVSVFLNTSRIAANDFNEKYCWRMNKRSAHEYMMSTPAQLLRSWHEQRPGNYGGLDLNITERLEEFITLGQT